MLSFPSRCLKMHFCCHLHWLLKIIGPAAFYLRSSHFDFCKHFFLTSVLFSSDGEHSVPSTFPGLISLIVQMPITFIAPLWTLPHLCLFFNKQCLKMNSRWGLSSVKNWLVSNIIFPDSVFRSIFCLIWSSRPAPNLLFYANTHRMFVDVP